MSQSSLAGSNSKTSVTSLNAIKTLLYVKSVFTVNTSELVEFKSKLEDRFGKTPTELNLLYNTVRLKWAGMEQGLEKIWMDGKTMKWYCPANPKSRFYSSGKFSSLMTFVAKFPTKFKIKESSKGLIVYIQSVSSVGEALHLLLDMQKIV